MGKQRELRDPIHGFIQRSDLEEKIIDTAVFQRLRRISQLAMAYLVYPGAMHTRFDHSLGVMHIAKRLAEQLIDDQETRRILSLAALLHDIGHGPFSHVSEQLLDKYYRKDGKDRPKEKEKIHERVTADIILNNAELGRYLSEHDRETIVDLLNGSGGQSIVRSVISGPLDADKQDYLLRDSYFCGVKYGIFDWLRLIGTLRVYREAYDQHLAASSGGVYAIEQFVIAKYHMSSQVYRHKTRLVSDSMIVRGLELGIENDGLAWLKDLYSYDGSEQFVANYLAWDDSRLVTEICQSPQSLCADIFVRLKERKLFKRIFHRPLREMGDAAVRNRIAEVAKFESFRREIEKEVAGYLARKLRQEIRPEYVIARTYAIKSIREESKNNEGQIVIVREDGTRALFEDESTLFKSINEKASEEFFDVYAPVEFRDEVTKARLREEFNREIHDLVVRLASARSTSKKPQQGGENVN